MPEVEVLPYLPGQFVSFTHEIGGKKITRAYSTASVPRTNRFELCLNRVEDGLFSPYLFQMNAGECLEMRGPLGHFTWKDPVRDSILVATGTGIAPFRGMLQSYLGTEPGRQITLVFGVRYEQSILYREEFEQMEVDFPNFRFLPTLSRPGEAWTGRKGHVQEHVFEVLGERRDMDVYICGMKAMVDDVRTRLKALGFDRRQIIFEKYD